MTTAPPRKTISIAVPENVYYDLIGRAQKLGYHNVVEYGRSMLIHDLNTNSHSSPYDVELPPPKELSIKERLETDNLSSPDIDLWITALEELAPYIDKMSDREYRFCKEMYDSFKHDNGKKLKSEEQRKLMIVLYKRYCIKP